MHAGRGMLRCPIVVDARTSYPFCLAGRTRRPVEIDALRVASEVEQVSNPDQAQSYAEMLENVAPTPRAPKKPKKSRGVETV